MRRTLCAFVCLATSLSAAAQTPAATAPAGQVVNGTVVDARDGHLLRHATVRLVPNGPGPRIESVTTNDEGFYSFGVVPVGKFNLSAVAPGYFSASFMQHEGFFSDILTGAGLDTTLLKLQLTRLASISGRILDDAGDPGQNTQVALYRVDPAGDTLPYVRAGNTGTDFEGRYSFKRLLPGRYFIAVHSTPWYAMHPRRDQPNAYIQYRSAIDPAVDVIYPTLFYPNTTRSEEAQPVDLQGGDEFIANLTLTPQPSVSFSIRLPAAPPGVSPQFPQIQLVHSVFGHDEAVQIAQSELTDGVLTFNGIAPDSYKVLQSSPGNAFATPVSTVDLSAGSATMQAGATTPLASLVVHLHADPPIPLSAQPHIMLRSLTDQYASAPLDAKNTANLQGIPPNDYTVGFSANGNEYGVKSLTVDGKPVHGHILHVVAAGALTAELTVIPRNDENDTNTIAGIAHRDGRPACATFVLLIPALAHYDNSDVRRDQTNLDGSYSFANVAPGNYILIAVDEGWKLHWQDPKSLMKYLEHGVPVTVPASGSKSIYRVPDTVNAQPL